MRKERFVEQGKRWAALLLMMAMTLGIGRMPHILQTGASENFRRPDTRDNAPVKITFGNGDFEEPAFSGSWAYFPGENTAGVSFPTGIRSATEYVPYWNVRPASDSDASHPSVGYIELKKVGGSSARGQSLEPITDFSSYVYQNFETTPGQRLYYSYEQIAPSGVNPVVRAYITDGNSDMMIDDIVQEEAGDGDWRWIEGLYIVPEGQTETSIGFENVHENLGVMSGANIDNVSVLAAPHLLISKSSDTESVDVSGGNRRFRYRLEVGNAGQIGAYNLQIRDMLGAGVRFVGDVETDLPAGHITYSADDTHVEFSIEREYILPEDGSFSISYEVEMDNFYNGSNTYTADSQASVGYYDSGYRHLYPHESRSYSNVFSQRGHKTDSSNTGGGGSSTTVVTDTSSTAMQESGLPQSTAASQESAGGGEQGQEAVEASFKKREGDLELELVLRNPQSLGRQGEVLHYQLILENKGQESLRGIWLRSYVPEYTGFDSSDALGEYGYIDGKEHVTWFVKELGAGKKRSLDFKVRTDYCVQGDIESEVYYALLGEEEKPYHNAGDNPSIKIN